MKIHERVIHERGIRAHVIQAPVINPSTTEAHRWRLGNETGKTEQEWGREAQWRWMAT